MTNNYIKLAKDKDIEGLAHQIKYASPYEVYDIMLQLLNELETEDFEDLLYKLKVHEDEEYQRKLGRTV